MRLERWCVLLMLLGSTALAPAQPPAQGPNQIPQNLGPVPPGFGRFGPSYLPQPAQATPPANAAGPLGQAWPHIGPDPAPSPIRTGRCPPGYLEPSNIPHQMHLVICVVQQANGATGQPNATLLRNGKSLAPMPPPDAAPPGLAPNGRPLATLPQNLEHNFVNQCLGRPAGSYACGRGGTECCGPNQANMCFPGAYACSPNGLLTGARTACCMSK